MRRRWVALVHVLEEGCQSREKPRERDEGDECSKKGTFDSTLERGLRAGLLGLDALSRAKTYPSIQLYRAGLQWDAGAVREDKEKRREKREKGAPSSFNCGST